MTPLTIISYYLHIAVLGQAIISTNKLDKFDIYLDDETSLKGVLDGKNYPLLFIDTEQHILRKQPHEKIYYKKADHDVTEVVAFCEHFIASTNDRLHLPYIVGEGERVFNVMPKNHEAKLDELSKCLQRITVK